MIGVGIGVNRQAILQASSAAESRKAIVTKTGLGISTKDSERIITK